MKSEKLMDMDKGGITFPSEGGLTIKGNTSYVNSNIFVPPPKVVTEPISAEEFKKALDPLLAMLTLLYDELQELKKKKEDN